jgi:hypothetical protein
MRLGQSDDKVPHTCRFQSANHNEEGAEEDQDAPLNLLEHLIDFRANPDHGGARRGDGDEVRIDKQQRIEKEEEDRAPDDQQSRAFPGC